MTFTNTAIMAGDLPEGKPVEYPVGGRTVGLLRRGAQVLAFSPKCPHAGAPLCDGWLDAKGSIVCPLHKYRFDPANGRNVSGEGYKLRVFPVALRGGEVWVGI